MKTLTNIQTKDHIARMIRDEILNGNIEPDEELAQEALAEMLGVSRMPVREALQTLVQEGFAKRLPNRHIQAVVLDSRQIHEVFQVASAMEGELAVLTLDHQNSWDGSEGIAKELKYVLKLMGETPDFSRQAEYEMEFHNKLLNMADNPYLEQLFCKIMDGYIAFAVQNLGDKNSVQALLARIVEAMEKKDHGGIKEGLQKYYLLYADELTERWKK